MAAAGATPSAAQGFGANVQVGYFGMAARDSAKAVFDSLGGLIAGGGLSYGFSKHFYAEAGVRYFKKDGERVFVASPGSPVSKLGFPLTARLIPVYGTVGYRLGGRGPLSPYVGLGGGVTSYREESTVAGITSKASQWKASGHALLGLEFGRGHLRFAAEVLYLTVPNAIGVGGVSQVYGETDLGGLVTQAKVVFSSRARQELASQPSKWIGEPIHLSRVDH